MNAGYYPAHTRIQALPATNAEANFFLGPVHRHTFQQLHRLDGAGWLQGAIWSFQTGTGGARVTHQTIFGYGINVFSSSRRAIAALHDVKLATSSARINGIVVRRFAYGDVQQTLVFAFWTEGRTEIEAYYEYKGVAPAGVSAMLSRLFGRQVRKIDFYARRLVRVMQWTPTPLASPTVTPLPSPTATVLPSATATLLPSPTTTATPSPTPLPSATATLTPTPLPSAPIPTATLAPSPTAQPTVASLPPPLSVQLQPVQDTVPPGGDAAVQITVTMGSTPVANAHVRATYFFGSSEYVCNDYTDSTGTLTCHATVPLTASSGSSIVVQVLVIGPNGESAMADVTFTVQ